MKKKIIVGALACMAMVPTSALAATLGTNLQGGAQQGTVHFLHSSRHEPGHGPKNMERMQERQDHLMDLVKKYTPELSGSFQKVFDERKQLMVQFKSRHEELRAKVKVIHDKVEKGELTKEQARAEMEKLGFKRDKGGKKHFELRKQLDEAVTAKDEAKIKSILPQLLSQMQERNRQLSEKFKSK